MKINNQKQHYFNSSIYLHLNKSFKTDDSLCLVNLTVFKDTDIFPSGSWASSGNVLQHHLLPDNKLLLKLIRPVIKEPDYK